MIIYEVQPHRGSENAPVSEFYPTKALAKASVELHYGCADIKVREFPNTRLGVCELLIEVWKDNFGEVDTQQRLTR